MTPVAELDLAGVATGVGSWPGTNPHESAAVVIGELGQLPHLVELPARGVGADMIGRASALLEDIHLDTQPRGYRIGTPGGSAARLARDYLHEDLDALEEAWERAGFAGQNKTIKVQAVGPFTLAAEVELRNGHRILTDAGAVRDIAESLAEGLLHHSHDVARRLGARVVVQLDEPMLPVVLDGGLRGVTAMHQIPALPGPDALDLLDSVVRGIGRPVLLHCCAKNVPLDLLRRSAVAGVGIDVEQLERADLDGVGELLQSGKLLSLGLVPGVAPERIPVYRELAEPALRLIDRLGFVRRVLSTQVMVTPRCGLAGATDRWARQALQLSQELARALHEEPEAL